MRLISPLSLVFSRALCALLWSAATVAAGERVELGEGAASARLTVGGAKVSLSMETRDVDGLSATVPVLTIAEGGRTRLSIVGAVSGFDIPQGTAEAVEMDPSAPGPEVVFTSYSGGAHCCTAVEIARRDPARGWERISFGAWDGGGPDMVTDVDGDGVAELVSVDNAFLYAFDCYACSEAPLTMRTLRDGRVADVGAEPRFRPAHRAWLQEMETRLAENGGERTPGFWAGWIATKARLGEGAAAMDAFRAAYDPATDEGVETCAVEAEVCPEADIRTVSFPEALEAFLVRTGYAP